jgi:SNF2 family DNA or RNA helicase
VNKLYPYQLLGSQFLAANKRAYLADVPGLGKTAQAIRAIMVLQGTSGTIMHILVVCPAVAIPVWQSEWAKWWPAGRPPTIVSYAKLAKSPPGSQIFDLVILDEAHYVKSPEAKRTRAALVHAARAERAWLLSGTPMPNNPSELYTVFNNLWPERIPPEIKTAHQWMDHFCTWYQPAERGWGPRITGSKNTKQLVEMLNGGTREHWRAIMLRRRVQDVDLQLPPLRLHVVPLPADVDFAEELETYVEEAGVETATVRRLLGAHKASRIARIVGDEQLSPIVLMYHHRDTGRELRHRLIVRGWRCYGFDGSHTVPQRAHEVERFQNDPKGPKCMIVQQQAGGTAITLTAAAEIILVEPDWSPGVNAQAIKRVHRIGSTRPVRARIFSVTGSLDEAIMETLATKIRMQQEVFGS